MEVEAEVEVEVEAGSSNMAARRQEPRKQTEDEHGAGHNLERNSRQRLQMSSWLT